MSKHPLIAILKKACQGLLFVSESEAELEPFVWEEGEEPTPDRLLKRADAEKGTPIETMDLGAFFRAAPKEAKAKFDALAKLLQEQLSGIKVYKVGEVSLTVFIVGKTKDGRWGGLKTEVVES